MFRMYGRVELACRFRAAFRHHDKVLGELYG
jgi:hypothetical protein